MLKNYLKTAFRNLWRNSGFSIINIAGLTFGITACFLIGLFVWDEKQFDKFIPDGERIYRIYTERIDEIGTTQRVGTTPMFATTLNQSPEVEQTVRIYYLYTKVLMHHNEKKIYEEKGILTDPSYPEIFPLPLKYGSWNKALEPGSIAISEDLALKYFGNTDPVGKEIQWDLVTHRITAVFKSNLPHFHLPVNYIIPLATLNLPQERMESWGWQQLYTYVKLKKNVDVGPFESRFQQTVKEKAQPVFSESGFTYTPYLQPLHDIHLYSSGFKFDMATRGNITYVKSLSLVAIFILLIACFNFINLATAKSLKRAKEIGVRKSVGAGRKQLIIQFIGETILLAFISVVIAVVLTISLLPVLNEFTDKQISNGLFLKPFTILIASVFALFVGILSGFYPAIVMSGFQPVKVLKGMLGVSNSTKIPWLRQGLVVTQFALSGLLIISVLIVFQQVNYLHNKDLGFNKEQILFFPLRGEKIQQHQETFKNEIANIPGVSSVAMGYGFPGDLFAGDEIEALHNGEWKVFSATQIIGDHDYVKTLGLNIIEGRDFSREIATDRDEAFIINETAVKELGFGDPKKAIGQKLQWNAWSDRNDSIKRGQVIGVVKDFHYKTLYDKVEIAIIQIYPGGNSRVAVKLNSENPKTTIAAIGNIWNKYSPDYPIEYWFLDENFETMYKAEDKLKTLLFTFTGIAIFVACLGLLGLAAYAAERRKKEIGIRKVLGASVNGITVLLSKDFMKLVVISLVIAAPVAWYFMNNWLQDFAYRITIQWTVFVIAAVFAITVALITVSFQAIKAALANPVKSLRTE